MGSSGFLILKGLTFLRQRPRFLHHLQTSTSPPADTGLAQHSSKGGLTLLILAPHSSKGGLTLLIDSSNPLLGQCCGGGSIALLLSPDCAFDLFIIHVVVVLCSIHVSSILMSFIALSLHLFCLLRCMLKCSITNNKLLQNIV